MDIDFSIFDYSVPDGWSEGTYRDRKQCCPAARPFSLLHNDKPDECWLIIQGYRGYPGEFVRPAVELYEAGFDVFVPRLPGHGTSRKDFIASHGKDWIRYSRNAAEDLKRRYSKVNILGHSMGAAIAAIIGSGDPRIGKIIYACPSFENLMMPFRVRLLLAVLSPFTSKLNCHWKPNSLYSLYYENAPCDDMYLGMEYWTWYFTRQLHDYYKISRNGLKAVTAYPHEHLLLCPEDDTLISVPSMEQYSTAVGDRKNVKMIEHGSHFLFYDKDRQAQEDSVNAVVEYAKNIEI